MEFHAGIWTKQERKLIIFSFKPSLFSCNKEHIPGHYSSHTFI